MQSSECLGADLLIQLLKNYSRNLNLKTSLSVGIIGYPNVGKSSLINSLKRSKAVGVGATPGFTKTAQVSSIFVQTQLILNKEIHLDKHVKLIDCPGIVFSNSSTDNDIILRNAVKVEQIPDPIEPVEIILKRCKVEQLTRIYNLANFSNVNEFLLQIAQKRGKLNKVITN
jgi:nuclear GTP-binding protein